MKKSIITSIIGATTIAAFSLTSCGGVEEKMEEVAEVSAPACASTELSYKKDILPIFEANCFSCHNEEVYARKADGNLMVGYSDIKKYLDEGLIIGNIERTQGFIGMPYKKEKIDSCDIEKIKAWAAAGALEN